MSRRIVGENNPKYEVPFMEWGETCNIPAQEQVHISTSLTIVNGDYDVDETAQRRPCLSFLD
eukprot:549806-Pyramimonas_sp.AAC.1